LADAPAGGTAAPMPAEEPPTDTAEVPDQPPLPPPAPPPAPALRAASTQPRAARPPAIDRACSLALFRFQQGQALSAADQAHIRNGCATTRR
jgi:hypothetical protein